jgi:hypothetical protein
MPTLYEIDHDLRQVEELLALGDDDQAAELLVQYRDQLEADRSAKVDATCGFIRELESRVAARKAEADRFLALARTDGNLADRLKAMLLDHLRDHGIKKLETERFRLTRAANGGKLPLVVDTHPDDLPDDFVRTVRQADTEAIREALESGEHLPFSASLAPRGEHLRLR